MTVEELKKEKDALAASISELVAAFQEKTGVYVSGLAVNTIVTVYGGGKGSRPPDELRMTSVGVGITLERP